MFYFLGVLGCIFITSDEAAERYDRDGDGVDVFDDCDDHDPAVLLPQDWYPDADGDGYGAGTSISRCEAPSGYTVGGDCDDLDASVHPDAAESCNEIDDDCDGETDEELTGATLYADVDGDGYGDPDAPLTRCDAASGYVDDATDCDDLDAGSHPGGEEVCDGADNDCDGAVDDAAFDQMPSWTPDGDGDGFGDASSDPTLSCDAPSGYGAPEDCDDRDPAVHPAAEEICGDGIDNDCDDAGCRPEGDLYLPGEATLYGGVIAGGYAGLFVAGPGDLTGDGRDDFVIGAPDQVEGLGIVFLMDGPHDGQHSLWDVAATLLYDTTQPHAWMSSADGAGDTDGDGDLDLLIGAPQYARAAGDASDNDRTGAAYLMRGPAGVAEADMGYLADATLLGEAGDDQAGFQVRGAGDANGDGLDDVLVGAPLAGDGAPGKVYLMLSPMAGTTELADADAILTGEGADDLAGLSIDGGPDLDGDGYDDFAVGAPGYADDRGAAYVIYGHEATTGSLGLVGDRLSGEHIYALAGYSVALPGDLDGDGSEELLVGSPGYSLGDWEAGGAVYLASWDGYGSADLSEAPHRFVGGGDFALLGFAAAGPGDVDGDGAPDLLFGAPYADETRPGVGEAFLYYGAPSAEVIDLSTDGHLRASGMHASDGAGMSLAGAGDVDQDGRADLLIGAPYTRTVTQAEGAAYLVYGSADF